MEKNKRNKIIGLSIGILIVLIIVVSSTYAYWQITKTQETPNDIVAACLNLDLADASAAIDLDSAWPISDEEGKNLTGYTFTVTNNCDEEINYIVGLNRVEESNYLLDSSIKLQLDENSSHVYEDLSDVEYSDAENTEYTARVSKQVSIETISGNGTNTHTIRVWINDEAPVTEQSKTFLGQVFITGGQGIEVKECFTIASDGTLLGYDESCGLDVKVPAEINGIKVKNISKISFNEYNNILIAGFYGEKTYVSGRYEYQYQDNIIYIPDESVYQRVADYWTASACEGDSECSLESLGTIVLVGIEQYNSYDWSKYEITEDMPYYIDEQGYVHDFENEIKSLDLSEAKYLEKIDDFAFYFVGYNSKKINETCIFNEEYNHYDCEEGNFYKLVLPQNGMLTYIGEDAFARNKLTGTLSIPAGVEVIENSAFSGNDLNKIIIPGSVNKLGASAFAGNPNLSEVIMIREDQTGLIIDSNVFPTNPIITYDPNYVE